MQTVIPESDSIVRWEFPFLKASGTASYAPTCWLILLLFRPQVFTVLVTDVTKPFEESAAISNSTKNEPHNSQGFSQVWIHPEETKVVPFAPKPGQSVRLVESVYHLI